LNVKLVDASRNQKVNYYTEICLHRLEEIMKYAPVGIVVASASIDIVHLLRAGKKQSQLVAAVPR
jgi:hypothetical protein